MPSFASSFPVFYSVNGSNPLPVPSTGTFGSMGKQSNAMYLDDAAKKATVAAQQNKLQLPPGAKMRGPVRKNNTFVVQYQTGGKRRKSRRGAKSRRNKTRKKTRRARK